MQVFESIGHADADRCYAWSHETAESAQRRFVAVLHHGGIDSPEAAVRAALIEEFRARGGR